jgi:hypothetical protein
MVLTEFGVKAMLGNTPTAERFISQRFTLLPSIEQPLTAIKIKKLSLLLVKYQRIPFKSAVRG